jgi:hypothetical protein
MTHIWRAGLAGLVVWGLAACTRVQDPWVSGDQYARERERPAAQADALRQRLLRVQTDR